jgi:signal transduction histidine kinase
MKDNNPTNEADKLDQFYGSNIDPGGVLYKLLDNNDIENNPGPSWENFNNLSLGQIIDLKAVKPLLENLSILANVSSELIDTNGEILVGFRRDDICTEFHSKHPLSFGNCQRNREKIKHIGLESGYQEFTCQNGLTDILLPIHVQGKLLGTFFIGPFFKKKNESFIAVFKNQVRKFGFDEAAYLKSLAAVPVISEEGTSCIINIFSGLIGLIKSIALRNLAIANEIEERTKQNRIVQEARQKAEESDKLKSAFLANMSHEIRTPMNSIIGFSELLTRENLNEEDRLAFIGIIKESGRNLLELIDDVIDLSRIEARQVIIQKRNFEINELTDELYAIFVEQSPVINKSHIKLICESSNYEPLIIYSDRLRVKQIFSNLLRNAYKFSDRGSIKFGFRKEGEEIIFYVNDSGIGITPEQQEFIFDRFRQGENNLSRKFGGAGLGLSIAKDLCHLLGGRIWVESRINSGSTFYFSLRHEIQAFNPDIEI